VKGWFMALPMMMDRINPLEPSRGHQQLVVEHETRRHPREGSYYYVR
jgi:hypothetical protein